MELTPAHYEVIENLLPVQRGNVTLLNLHVLNAILYVAEHGCKWRRLPKEFGNWHSRLYWKPLSFNIKLLNVNGLFVFPIRFSIYMRANRWTKRGVLDRVFVALQERDVINIEVKHVSLDSTAVKAHPDGTGH